MQLGKRLVAKLVSFRGTRPTHWSEHAEFAVLVNEESPLQKNIPLYNIILKLLADCEPQNGPGRALVVAASLDDI